MRSLRLLIYPCYLRILFGFVNFAPLELYGKKLPFVKEFLHLGIKVTDNPDLLEEECKLRRNIYVSRCCELKEEMTSVHPRELVNLTKIYCSDWYGCVLWDFDHEYCNKVWNCTNNTIRAMYDIPRNSHVYIARYLGDDTPQLKYEICSRYRKFFSSLVRHPSEEVVFLARLLQLFRYDFYKGNRCTTL